MVVKRSVAGMSERTGVGEVVMVQLSVVLLLITLTYLNNPAVMANEEEVTMVTFQDDLYPTNMSWIWWEGEPIPNMTQVTFCVRHRIRRFRSLISLVSYSTPRTDNELAVILDPASGMLYFSCCTLLTWRTPVSLQLMDPIPLCLSLDLQHNNITLVYNDQVETKVLNFKRPLLPGETGAVIQGGGHLVFGVDQDEHGHRFSAMSSLCGDLSDAELYSMLMSVPEMLSFGNCTPMTMSQPPVADFTDMELYKQGDAITISKVSRELTCSRNVTPFQLVFPEDRQFLSSVRLCHASGGNLILPTDDEQNLRIVDLAKKYQTDCGGDSVNAVWLGLRANLSNKTWVHYLTGQPVQYKQFPMEYNYMTEAMSCAALSDMPDPSSYWYARWYPAHCKRDQKCTICHYQDIVMFTLRGLCESSLFDRDYVLFGPQDGKPSFLGVSFSHITWRSADGKSPTHGRWILTDDKRKDLFGKMKLSINEYPIGRKQWQVENDKCDATNMKLLLTRCGDDEFTCDDGTCIPLKDRCDLTIHCDDSSDEHNCKTVVKPGSYRRYLPPPGPKTNDALQMNLTVAVDFIKSLDVLKFSLEQDLFLQFHWHDSRLLYRQLNHDISLNTVEERTVWEPQLDILGNGDSSTIITTHSRVTNVLRYTEPLPRNIGNIWEDTMHNGSTNPLTLTEKATVTSSCYMDLTKYPFDTQECHLVFVISKFNKKDVVISRSSVEFSSQRILLEYKVEHLRKKSVVTDGRSGVKVILTFRNLYGYYISNTYVPTFLLLIISYMTFFFDLQDFTDRIMVSLTSLLVLASLFTQTSNTIPKTAYLKLIDVWFVFCISLDFMMVVLLVLTNVLYSRAQQKVSVNVVAAAKLPQVPGGKILKLKPKSTKVSGKNRFRRVRNWRVPNTAPTFNKAVQSIIPFVLSIFISVYIYSAF